MEKIALNLFVCCFLIKMLIQTSYLLCIKIERKFESKLSENGGDLVLKNEIALSAAKEFGNLEMITFLSS